MPLEPSPRKRTPLPTQTKGLREEDLQSRQRELRREDSGVIPSTISMPSSSFSSFSSSSSSLESTPLYWDMPTAYQVINKDKDEHDTGQSSCFEDDDHHGGSSPVLASLSPTLEKRLLHQTANSTSSTPTPPSPRPTPVQSTRSRPRPSSSPEQGPVGLSPLKRKKKNQLSKTQGKSEPDSGSDSDPIIDFDSDDGTAAIASTAVVGPSRQPVNGLSDEIILHSLVVPSTPKKPRRPIMTLSPRRRGGAMDSPTVNQQTFSPSRLQRQVQATSAVRNHLPSPVLPLASPSKRMRPVSELPRKLAPAFSSVSSPTAKGVSVAVAAPSSSAANGTDLASPERPTPISPTRKLTEIARTLQRPAGSDLRKPAPLGPKLSKIAEEIRIEQEDKKMQHRQAKEEKISDSHADYIREQKKKARERQSSPSMGLRAESMSTGYGDFYLSSPIEDNDKNKERSTDKDLMPRYLSSSSSSSSRAGYLQRSESPQEEPPSFVYNTEDLKPRSRPVGVYSSQEQEQEKSPPPQQQRQENAFENEEREARERKKQELLSEVQAMRKQTTVMPPPSVSLRPRSAAAPATSTASVTTTNQTQVPPLAPPSTPVGNQGYVGENPGEDASPISIPSLVLEYAPKLTSIDQINRPPARDGRFHIFALIIAIEPMETITAKSDGGRNNNINQGGSSFQKVLVSVCDHSATTFKVILWRDKASWIDHFKPGDVVLFTDLQMKDYRNKISGNSSGWSKMSRVDGTVLARYKGPRNLVANSTIIESRLRVFSEKRRVLALDLLDPDKGIARPSSFYLSAPMSLLDQLLQHHQDQEQEQELQQRQGQQQGRPGSKSTAPSRATGTATTSGSNNDVARLPALVNSISTTAATSALPSSRATTSTTAPSAATVITAPLTTSSTISLIRPAMTKAIPPTAGITGTSIRASVVYRMLIIPNDESAGWEVGAVMSNGRFVRVQSTLNTSAWIQNAAPGRLLKFFGQFVKQSDGSTIFSLDGATRNPDSLAESGWGNAVKNIELKKFPSIQSLREHRYMGDAVLEETTILTVDFPDLTDNYNVDDLDPDAMLSFIKCYCRDCTSPAESSPQNPAIFYCPHCHLRQKSSLEWYYPPFQMTLIDLKKKGSQRTKLGATLSTEMLQVRCQLELGDQVFPTVPASEWVGEGDVAKFWRCKESWTEIMANFNSGSDEDTDDNDHDQSTKDHGQRHQYQRNARVEVRVGLNFVAKALAVRYLS